MISQKSEMTVVRFGVRLFAAAFQSADLSAVVDCDKDLRPASRAIQSGSKQPHSKPPHLQP
ncbi:MAG: hypothetical protein EXS18_04970 [Verrucomicrobiae bacterium]|nr:hypothetical protein [Verrucomicrobiae bacterium]